MRSFVGRIAAFVLLPLVGCGDELPLIGDFTSEIVQRDSCRLVGDDDRERCVRDEIITTQRVTLLEDDFDRVWIIGLDLEGEQDRRVLGTRDSQGGFLFEYESRETNSDTGCSLTTTLLMSLAIDDSADEALVGVDPCIPLIGRETRRSITSVECDSVNVPPARIERITRRRWEPSPTCGDE